MSLELVGGIAGPLVGVAGLGAGYYYYSQGRRRNQLIITVEAQSWGEPDPQLSQGLLIRYDEQRINKPCFVTVSLTCAGPKDIVTTDFDSGKPLRIQLGAMIVAIPQINELELEKGGGEIYVSPGLLPKGKTITVKLIADGDVDEKTTGIVNPIINTDIVTKAIIQ